MTAICANGTSAVSGSDSIQFLTHARIRKHSTWRNNIDLRIEAFVMLACGTNFLHFSSISAVEINFASANWKKEKKKSFLSCRKFRVDLSIAMGQKSFYWNVIADRMWKLNCETRVGNWAASRFPIIEPGRWISRVKWVCDGCGCTRVKREKL